MIRRNGKEAVMKVEQQIMDLKRRIEAQKSQAEITQATNAAKSILLKPNESAGSLSLDFDHSNHSRLSPTSFGDGKEGGEMMRRTSLRLPPLTPRGVSPSKHSPTTSSKSRLQAVSDRMYDVIMLDQMMPVMVTQHPHD